MDERLGEGALTHIRYIAILILAAAGLRAGTFTPITVGLDWQDKDFINEFRNAQSERSQVIGGAVVTNIVAGVDVQTNTFWADIQLWLVLNSDEFVDHTIDLTTTNVVTLFTLATWRNTAGITNGFRRATVWNPPTAPTYSYGRMARGDIIGPWIFEDLQDGFDALRWTHVNNGFTPTGPVGFLDSLNVSNTSYIAGEDTNCAAARAGAMLNWTNKTYSAGGNGNYFASASKNDGGPYQWTHRRDKSQTRATPLPTVVPHIYKLYSLPYAPSVADFYDIDSLGLTQDKFWLEETLPVATTNTRDTSMFWPDDTAPIEVIPVTCADAGRTWRVEFSVEADSTGIMQWQFTHTNAP